MIPLYQALMPFFEGHSTAFERFIELVSAYIKFITLDYSPLAQVKESAVNSRTGDTNTCKSEVLNLWIRSEPLRQILRKKGITTVKPTDKKSRRGWNDAQCAQLLTPLRLQEEFFEDPS